MGKKLTIQQISDEVRKFFSMMGQKGGSAAFGEKKRRDKEHYKKMVEIRRQNREKLKENQSKLKYSPRMNDEL